MFYKCKKWRGYKIIRLKHIVIEKSQAFYRLLYNIDSTKKLIKIGNEKLFKINLLDEPLKNRQNILIYKLKL